MFSAELSLLNYKHHSKGSTMKTLLATHDRQLSHTLMLNVCCLLTCLQRQEGCIRIRVVLYSMKKCITLPQNHRGFEAGRDLWRSSSLTFLKQAQIVVILYKYCIFQFKKKNQTTVFIHRKRQKQPGVIKGLICFQVVFHLPTSQFTDNTCKPLKRNRQ